MITFFTIGKFFLHLNRWSFDFGWTPLLKYTRAISPHYIWIFFCVFSLNSVFFLNLSLSNFIFFSKHFATVTSFLILGSEGPCAAGSSTNSSRGSCKLLLDGSPPRRLVDDPPGTKQSTGMRPYISTPGPLYQNKASEQQQLPSFICVWDSCRFSAGFCIFETQSHCWQGFLIFGECKKCSLKEQPNCFLSQSQHPCQDFVSKASVLHLGSIVIVICWNQKNNHKLLLWRK